VKEQEQMNPDDKFVIFKLYDMKYPIAGRVTNDNKYVYVHRADGLILAKYTFGFQILKTIENKELIQQTVENF
jgi:hypothetical protein